MKRINVTQTYMPPLGRYEKYLKKIWKTRWLTNKGPNVQQLEEKLKEYLYVTNLRVVSNATLGLQLSLRALIGRGTVITTPFSYIASSSIIQWEGSKIVFADIKPDTLCIDPVSIEKNITKDTKAILAVHVYGNACDIEAIEAIAKKNKLKVIYDAAHSFGVTYKGESILNYGDASILSFHATKVFQTVEGGAVLSRSNEVDEKISYMRNFGHKGYEDFYGTGINAKMSEFHAAMGLCMLPDIDMLIKKRKSITELYDILLKDTILRQPIFPDYISRNYSYYPVIFKSETQLLRVMKALNDKQIFPRRYFYPALSTLKFLSNTKCPIAEDVSRKVICLPLYPELKDREVKRIVSTLISSL
jgi:dTDP-4-amino-4,6-dideoxygalactose transaminase